MSRALKNRRDLEYVCGRCGRTVLEVLNTGSGLSVACRLADPDRLPKVTGNTGRERALDYLSKAGPACADRAGLWHSPVPADFVEVADPDWLWMSLCRCREWTITSDTIAADLRDGRRKRVLHDSA